MAHPLTDPPLPPLLRHVGGTPLVELPRFSPKPGVRIWAKLEGANPSGSIKDRVALALVREAREDGRLADGQRVVEASTGNTGIALAMVCRQYGHPLTVVIPEGVVPSISDILELYGVDIVWVKPRAGMRGAIEHARELATTRGWHLAGQFSSSTNIATHYGTTGAEIDGELDRIDAFVAGIGTGGTLMGVGRRLRERNPQVKLVGVEPRMGERLQGLRSIKDGYHPPLLDLTMLDARYLVGAADALGATHRVVREEAVLAGVSSGAALHAALRFAEKVEEANIVVMFADGGWKYLPARPWEAAAAGKPDLDEIHWW